VACAAIDQWSFSISPAGSIVSARGFVVAAKKTLRSLVPQYPALAIQLTEHAPGQSRERKCRRQLFSQPIRWAV
jgi:hypothetical protein